MKKHPKLVFLIIALLILAISAFIYKQPAALDEIVGAPSLDGCIEFAYTSSYYADTSTFGGPFKHSEAQLRMGSEGFEEMMSLFEGKKFARSFLPVSYKGGTVITNGSYDMTMSIFFDENEYIVINKHYDKQMWISYRNKTYRLSFDKDDPWFSDLFELMKKYEDNKIIT
ncbi:MAG: hypothetical protein IKU13_02175 [Clostridia bacterium]|nr:hypothetical protein [Clostridia bacterium]MBR5265730.1 hypothetical protein [Clostridia bacterium]